MPNKDDYTQELELFNSLQFWNNSNYIIGDRNAYIYSIPNYPLISDVNFNELSYLLRYDRSFNGNIGYALGNLIACDIGRIDINAPYTSFTYNFDLTHKPFTAPTYITTPSNILDSWQYYSPSDAYLATGAEVLNQDNISWLNWQTSGFADFDATFNYVLNHIRHADLYVDGELWNGASPISYNWQSVPSISGKNGILQSLVQIKEEALNDGEPVSEATVLSFDSLGNINIPSVIDEQMPVDPSDVTSVTATYLIPALENGTYEGIKLLVKKGSIPTSEEDADKVVNLDEPTSILRIDSKSVGNLDEDSHYYFMVKLIDELGTEATSDPKDIWTSHSEGWNYDYTGEIQTFVAPKTGIYSLETWGAQGGDATDGTLTARGGYGAYAVGEVFLTQGETLYINVGGQNGYGGGGNFDGILSDFEDIAKNIDFANAIQSNSTANIPQLSLNTEDNIYVDFTGEFLTDSYSDGVITMQAQRFSDTYMMIPLNKHYNIKRIEFDAKITLTNQSNDAYNIGIRTCDCWDSDKSLHWSGLDTMGMYNNNGTYGFNVPNFDWNSYGYDVNLTANYLVFLARNVNPAQYKNIKVYVESL